MSAEIASLPVLLVWILGGVAGLVVGLSLRPWWANADLSGHGMPDLILRHDCRGGYLEFLHRVRTRIWPDFLGSNDPENNHNGVVFPISELGGFRGSFSASPG